MVTRYGCILVLTAAVICGCAAQPSTPQQPGSSGLERTIYVLSHGWHTGIVVRYADIPVQLWPEKADFSGSRYLEVGWGDEAFYRAQTVTLAMVLKAAFVPTRSVLHVVGFNREVAEFFAHSDIVELQLSEQGFVDLAQYIHDGFTRREGRTAVALGLGLYGTSRFYQANGTYSLFYNCNHWVAGALRQAGVPIVAAIALTSGNVLSQVSRVGRVVRLGEIHSEAQ